MIGRIQIASTASAEIAISFEALFPVREDDQDAFLVQMSKAQLSAAPTFKRSR